MLTDVEVTKYLTNTFPAVDLTCGQKTVVATALPLLETEHICPHPWTQRATTKAENPQVADNGDAHLASSTSTDCVTRRLKSESKSCAAIDQRTKDNSSSQLETTTTRGNALPS